MVMAGGAGVPAGTLGPTSAIPAASLPATSLCGSLQRSPGPCRPGVQSTGVFGDLNREVLAFFRISSRLPTISDPPANPYSH